MAGFQIVAEFVFHEAATGGLDKVQRKLDGVANSAARAMNTVQGLGVNLIASMSGLGGGMLGMLYKALSASDKFKQSQLDLTKVLSGNKEYFKDIGDFNNQLAISKSIIKDISMDAMKFGLDEHSFVQMFKGISAMLIPKGLAGDNLKDARNISRDLMKSAPVLGIDPGMVQGQMMRMIEGSASGGDTLFRRLRTEAPESFKAAGVKNAKGFNLLPTAKRVEILSKSLNKFASNAKVLDMRANSLSGTIQRVKNLFFGLFGVLNPIGELITNMIVPVMNDFIDVIHTKGRVAIELLVKMFGDMFGSSRELFGFFNQIKNISKGYRKRSSSRHAMARSNRANLGSRLASECCGNGFI